MQPSKGRERWLRCRMVVEVTGIRHLVERFYRDAWNCWDDAAVDQLLAPGFVFRGSLGDEASGRDGFRAYRDKVRSAFPDFHNELRGLVAEGDRAAARIVCTGHHEGEVLGIAPTGVRVAYDAAAFFQAKDSHLEEAWVLGDLARLRAQLRAGGTTQSGWSQPPSERGSR
jgi:predicted ester cyclase